LPDISLNVFVQLVGQTSYGTDADTTWFALPSPAVSKYLLVHHGFLASRVLGGHEEVSTVDTPSKVMHGGLSKRALKSKERTRFENSWICYGRTGDDVGAH
jgi:hypothetical protein